MTDEVAALASKQAEAQAKSEPAALTDAQLDARPFEEIARIVIKWLNDNHHPHTSMLVTPTDAELFEGVKALQTTDYVKD